MADTDQNAPVIGTQAAIVILGLAVAAVVLFAIIYRSGEFKVVAKAGDQQIEFDFGKNQVSLSQMLDHMLSDEAKGGMDAQSKKRLVRGILRDHGFYQVPSVEAASAIRRMNEADDEARDFVKAIRNLLHDLAGPFSRPETLLDARDDRILGAFDDLNKRNPASPIIAKLWEMSLEFKGFLSLRKVKIALREDATLKPGVAATCAGSILLHKNGFIFTGDQLQPVEVLVSTQQACEPISPLKLLNGERTKVWISPTDARRLLGDTITLRESGRDAEIAPLPARLRNSAPES